ncbi:MAG: TonB-dependent receptor, partial [Candidatus Tectomicrobia bacterium]|nr:TonB-dependent receptor [Candidatus Tectomicrobia bacterium]
VGDSVEVFTRDRIELSLPADFSDLLREGVGINMDQSGARGAIASIRIRGSENNFGSVLLDGFKLSPPDGDAFDFAHMPVEWLRGAEILRGPQSTLYGSDAASGVINLLLDIGRPGERPSFETSFHHGSYSTFEEVLKAKGGWEKGGYLATLSRVDTNGRFRNDGYYRTAGLGALDYFPSPTAKLHLLVMGNRNRRDQTSSDGAANTEFRLPAGLTDRELNAYQRATEQMVGASLDLRPTRWLEYIPRAVFYQRDFVFNDPADALDATRPFFSEFKSDNTQTRYLTDHQVNLRFTGQDLRWDALTSSVTTVGFQWEEERFFQAVRGSSNTTENHERLARSLYFHQQLTFRDRLTLTGGARVDDFDKGADDVTGKLSASYLYGPTGTRVRGAMGSGTKRPSFNDLFFFSDQGFLVLRGNPNLESERQESWEAGVDQYLMGRRLVLSATYFENTLKDLISFSFAGFPNGTNNENISKVETKGVELSLALVDFRDFTVRANWNYLDTIVADDRDGSGGQDFRQGQGLLRRPHWWWGGALSYHPGPFRATLSLREVGQRPDRDFTPLLAGSFTFPRVHNPRYMRADLALAYDLIRDRKPSLPGLSLPGVQRLTVELKVNNLADKDYDEVFGFNAPGINWMAGLRLHF